MPPSWMTKVIECWGQWKKFPVGRTIAFALTPLWFQNDGLGLETKVATHDGSQLKSKRLEFWWNASGICILPKGGCQRWRRCCEMLWSHWRSSDTPAPATPPLQRHARADYALIICFVYSAQRSCTVYGSGTEEFTEIHLPVLFNFCRRVNTELALQCTDADLLILEGMGRCVIHLWAKMQLTSCGRKL